MATPYLLYKELTIKLFKCRNKTHYQFNDLTTSKLIFLVVFKYGIISKDDIGTSQLQYILEKVYVRLNEDGHDISIE